MKKRFLLLLCGLYECQFLLAQTTPVEQQLPLQEIVEQEEIFKVEQRIPHFPGCEDMKYGEERLKCAEEKMCEYLYANIRYPKFAMEQGIEGKVVIKFVVERDGSIIDVEITEDIGAGCGAEVFRVVYSMPKWAPSSPRARTVRCQFILPIEFNLQKGKPVRPSKINLQTEILPLKPTTFYDENGVYKYVEYPPMFPGCEGIEVYIDKQKCAEAKLLQFIIDNLKYPRKARRKKIEGMVYVTFIIEKNGSISNAKLMSDIGEGCGEEALRVVGLLPNWTPGKQRGQLIRYQYELPIVFSLK
jgi:TonB family protein